MSILIKGGYILTLDGQDRVLEKGDILIVGDTIACVDAEIDLSSAERVIDAKQKLVMPGLNVAHVHTSEYLFKGISRQLPHGHWGLEMFPPGDFSIPIELVYPCTILAATEMIMSGATTVQDDIVISSSPEDSHRWLDAVFQAYDDIGMRASVMVDMMEKPFLEKFPFFSKTLPQSIVDTLNVRGAWTADIFIHLSEHAINKWHGRGGRLNYVLSPSGPQWCTDTFLVKLGELSEKYDLPIHTHVLETKIQQVSAEVLYGKSVVEHLKEIGLLTPRTTLVHCVWLTNSDIDMIADAGASVVHCPSSNLKLGSGLMPLRALLDAGCNVALGVDGANSNDAQNPFEMMKTTALLHTLRAPNARHWPTSREILRMATHAGARSELIQHEVGSLSVGMKADIILLNLDTIHWTPMHDPKQQLVYCEPGSSVDTSIVNGKLVMEGRKIQTVNIPNIAKELGSLMPAFQDSLKKAQQGALQFWPYLDEIYYRVASASTGLNRWLENEVQWTKQTLSELMAGESDAAA